MHTIKQLFDLTNKTALITSRKQAELDEAVAHLKQRGVDVMAVASDLSKESAVTPLVVTAMKHLGHIDILINNAGATWGAPAEDHPLEAWDKVMNLNVRSIFLLSQAVGKQSMIPRRYGRIVNIASIAGLSGNGPDMQTLAYNTSKAAVINFTRTLAGEWGQYGITVNALAPGFFPSKMSRGLLEKMGDAAAERAPLRRLGDDEDLKGAVLLFATDAGKHITGQTLAVDGGVSAIII
jgi:NAD(P)-dependent dehydrogenase (short-subunit alcohol dehydrogenase family)